MRINLIANRSYNDINQYPIFPWIISKYDEKINNNNYSNKLFNKIFNYC